MGLATLASTRPSAQSIPISDALATLSKGVGDIGIDVATSPVHPYWQRIGDIVNRGGDIVIDAATSSVHSYWRRIGDVVNSGGHQPGPLLLATHWRHRQRGWRHWRRRGHQPNPFLLATHWRHRQRGWRHWHRHIHQPSPLLLATSSMGLATLASTRPSAQSIPMSDALVTSSTGLATLASTGLPAHSIPIGNALATMATGDRTGDRHCMKLIISWKLPWRVYPDLVIHLTATKISSWNWACLRQRSFHKNLWKRYTSWRMSLVSSGICGLGILASHLVHFRFR